MWSVIGYCLLGLLWLFLMFLVLGITLFSIGTGLSIGIYPGIFYAVKNYVLSVKENITHPFMKVVSYISIGIGVAIPVLAPVLAIILSVVL